MKPFQPPQTSGLDRDPTLLDRIFGLVRESFDSLRSAVTNDNLVRQAIAVTDTKVFHGLGVSPRTWEIVGTNGPGVVYESATANQARPLYVVLVATAPVTVTIRFT